MFANDMGMCAVGVGAGACLAGMNALAVIINARPIKARSRKQRIAKIRPVQQRRRKIRTVESRLHKKRAARIGAMKHRAGKIRTAEIGACRASVDPDAVRQAPATALRVVHARLEEVGEGRAHVVQHRVVEFGALKIAARQPRRCEVHAPEFGANELALVECLSAKRLSRQIRFAKNDAVEAALRETHIAQIQSIEKALANCGGRPVRAIHWRFVKTGEVDSRRVELASAQLALKKGNVSGARSREACAACVRAGEAAVVERAVGEVRAHPLAVHDDAFRQVGTSQIDVREAALVEHAFAEPRVSELRAAERNVRKDAARQISARQVERSH
ncbi:hypothetical protein [Paraburkholderia sp. BCC1876]|uniref:hypothetical protein n=1 Tax=Paraburkholderia sp. BCC1876 TaxID=2676303 RepID=UPI001FC81131|nr:hypothetical protein [Paraburkholderia sp. BCC1876]